MVPCGDDDIGETVTLGTGTLGQEDDVGESCWNRGPFSPVFTPYGENSDRTF